MCLSKLDDLQLAIVITRLYKTELDEQMPQQVTRLLYQECIGADQHGANQDIANAHPDPFIRSMAHWMLKDYSASLGTTPSNVVTTKLSLDGTTRTSTCTLYCM